MKSIEILKEIKKSNKGITLVALVITVIILIILAGVTIAGLTGEKGLIKEAKTAKELTELAGLEEQIDLAIIKAEQKHRNPTIDDVITELINNKVISDESRVNKETGAVHTDVGYLIEGKLDDYIGKTSTGDGNTTGNNTTSGNTTGNENTEGGTTEEQPKTLPSTADTKPFLPTGATVLENDIDKGIVIRDSDENEWVWIEVPKSIYNTTTTKADYAAIETAMKTYANDYIHSQYADQYSKAHGFASTTEYNNWKNSMLESVFTNGGFYIGRYEMGTETPIFAYSADLKTPVIKQDMYPYNFVTCAQAQTLSQQLSTAGKQASLMFGIQWDLVMKFIEEKGGKTQEELKTNSKEWGNYRDISFDVNRGLYTTAPSTSGSWNSASNYSKPASEVLLTTGTTTRNSTLNIYDLAGNVWEWTLEKRVSGITGTEEHCSYRGGSCWAAHYATNSRLFGNYTLDNRYYIGSRPALW